MSPPQPASCLGPVVLAALAHRLRAPIFALLPQYALADEMDVDDAVHASIMTLREGFEGEVTASNIEIAMAVADESCPAGGRFMVLPVADVDDYLAEAE